MRALSPPAGIIIRDQTGDDFVAVHDLVFAAFKTMPFACGYEPFIMDALWRTGAATVALVAEARGEIMGQATFSKVLAGGRDVSWHGCGPVSVLPERQRQGIGCALMRVGLERLHTLGSAGCIVVGHPDFYRRFGFENSTAMYVPSVPPEVFLAICFSGAMPKGEVKFDAAFEATG